MEEDPTQIVDLITTIQNEMATFATDSEEYKTRLSSLERLYTLKQQEAPKRLSRDTMATVAANVLGILMIVSHERVHVITSKAFSHIYRPK